MGHRGWVYIYMQSRYIFTIFCHHVFYQTTFKIDLGVQYTTYITVSNSIEQSIFAIYYEGYFRGILLNASNSLADGAIASGLNKDDVNAIITDLVKQAAVEAEDPDILKVFNYIEQGAGGIMANTSEVRLVIEKTKDEIIAKQATKIKQYNLNKTYLEGRKQEILNDGW